MRRLKIISSANLKLIISVSNHSYYYVQYSSCYHLLPQLGTLHLTLRACLRLANRPSTQFRNSCYTRTILKLRTTLKLGGRVLPFCQVKEGISRASLRWALPEQETPFNFFPTKKREKLLRTSYVRGPHFNSSSSNCRVLCSRNLSSQCKGYYESFIQ